MDMLRNKLQLFKDLSSEHHASVQSLCYFKNTMETVIEHMERQMVFRVREKESFKTKIGVSVRQNVLEMMNGIIGNLQQIYCSTADIHTQMVERQLSIEEVIKQGYPLVREIQTLSKFINETNTRYQTASSALSFQEEKRAEHLKLRQFVAKSSFELNKENIRLENGQNVRRESGSRYRMNMMLIAREGNEGFLKASHKLKQFQIMELSLVIDECLGFVSNMKFLKEVVGKQSRRRAESVSIIEQMRKSEERRENIVSLGLESMKGKVNDKMEDIDLLCDEDINMLLPIPKKCMSENLQRITEREEEHENEPLEPKTVNHHSP